MSGRRESLNHPQHTVRCQHHQLARPRRCGSGRDERTTGITEPPAAHHALPASSAREAEALRERTTGIEPASSAWKAEVLAVELRPREALRVPARILLSGELNGAHDGYRPVLAALACGAYGPLGPRLRHSARSFSGRRQADGPTRGTIRRTQVCTPPRDSLAHVRRSGRRRRRPRCASDPPTRRR